MDRMVASCWLETQLAELRLKNRISDKLFWSQINEFSYSIIARSDKLSKVVHSEIVIIIVNFILLCVKKTWVALECM